MEISRRDFLKLAGTVGATAAPQICKPEILEVFAKAQGYWHICWINGAGCTGCSVSFFQATDPDVIEILTSITVGTSGLPIALPDWMDVLHPASGTLAKRFVDYWVEHVPVETKKILVVEGSVQEPGYCETLDMDFRDLTEKCAQAADYVIAFGSCSSYGGVPKATPNVTGARGVADFLEEKRIDKPVINLPRCPGHPDSLVLTLAAVIAGVVPELDELGRPKVFYGTNMHNQICPYRPYFDRRIFLTPEDLAKPEAEAEVKIGCTFKIGCKGPIAFVDCAIRKWNLHSSYCVETGGPCIACSEPEFPDGKCAPFYKL